MMKINKILNLMDNINFWVDQLMFIVIFLIRIMIVLTISNVMMMFNIFPNWFFRTLFLLYVLYPIYTQFYNKISDVLRRRGKL
jgi:hypothetical protein